MIEVKNLTQIYSNGEIKLKALDNVSCKFDEGKLHLIIGPSGCGKTTLLNCLGLLEKPTEGKVLINGVDIYGIKDKIKKFNFRRDNIGYIYQDFNLIESLTVYENIILTASFKGMKINEEQVKIIAKKLGIEDKLNEFPSKISGGQRQRTAIARSLCADTMILLADEPTGNLDTKTSEDVMNVFRECIQDYSLTVIMVTHNLDFIKYADNVIKLIDGKVGL